MLRRVSAKIRKEGPSTDLRWNEKCLKQTIDRFHATFMTHQSPEDPSGSGQLPGSGASGSQENSGLASSGAPIGDPSAQRPGQVSVLASDGISFKVPPGRKLSEPVKQALKKVHCSLGHPSKEDLKRFLKLGGVKGEVLDAVGWMECIACQHHRKPVSHRTASIPPPK